MEENISMRRDCPNLHRYCTDVLRIGNSTPAAGQHNTSEDPRGFFSIYFHLELSTCDWIAKQILIPSVNRVLGCGP